MLSSDVTPIPQFVILLPSASRIAPGRLVWSRKARKSALRNSNRFINLQTPHFASGPESCTCKLPGGIGPNSQLKVRMAGNLLTGLGRRSVADREKLWNQNKRQPRVDKFALNPLGLSFVSRRKGVTEQMATHIPRGREAESLMQGPNWVVVDAAGQVLGRLATTVARV